MTEEMYKRLNNYLNDIFVELNKRDKIFVDNLQSIVILNTIINENFTGHITEEYANLSVKEILNTVGIKVNGEMIDETINIINNSINNGEKTKW